MRKAILAILLTATGIFIAATGIFAQGIEVNISSDSTKYSHRFSFGRDRYMMITTTFKNNTGQSVYLKTDPQFDLDYLKDGFAWAHCFRMYEYEKLDDSTFAYYKFNRFESFVKIEPGEEFASTGYYSIGWLCRNAPPNGIWEFNVTYHSVLTTENNYYLENSTYTDLTSKQFVDAWVGELNSNTLKIVIR